MSWLIGKTMVGLSSASVETPASTERRAQAQLEHIIRQHIVTYKVLCNQQMHYGPLMKLERMADTLESGKWPVGSDGLNWFWSIPMGGNPDSNRDCWVFWAKYESDGSGGGGKDADLVPLVPRGGIKREAVAA